MNLNRILSFFLFLTPAICLSAADPNLLAIGQGISSPSRTSTINYTNGWTNENPVGAVYQKMIRLTGQFSTKNSNNTIGGELAAGNGNSGFAAGFEDECDGCSANYGISLATNLSGIGMGVGFNDGEYSLGFITSPTGIHRLGFQLDVNKSVTSNMTYGFGYSYVTPGFRFTVDASKRSFGPNDGAILVTPGFSLQMNFISLSVSYDTIVNSNSGNGGDLWAGIGFGTGSGWHLALYHQYDREIAVVGSLFF